MQEAVCIFKLVCRGVSQLLRVLIDEVILGLGRRRCRYRRSQNTKVPEVKRERLDHKPKTIKGKETNS